ncbi:hypothetical protein VTJ04DRAFT_2493 [Mycothermus thermophilus]|uniref:uncharacterized protein n=1 Tax=Humicola insolens TaxID=85995 RepID=UPI003742EA54
MRVGDNFGVSDHACHSFFFHANAKSKIERATKKMTKQKTPQRWFGTISPPIPLSLTSSAVVVDGGYIDRCMSVARCRVRGREGLSSSTP